MGHGCAEAAMMTEDPCEGDRNEVAAPSRPDHAPMSAGALKAVLDRHHIWVETSRAHGARAMLAGACLQGLSLWRAELSDANLEGADLRGANLDHAVLRGALLRGACLAQASLWRADLSAADLASADLRDAKLDHAVLRAAILRQAKVDRASFWEARLEGADLRDAAGLVPAQLQPAFRDADTRLPAFQLPSGMVTEVSASVEGASQPLSRCQIDGIPVAEIWHHLSELEREEGTLRRRQVELERVLFAAPSATWMEAAERAQYLLTLFAAILDGQDPSRRQIIASVVDDLARLSSEQARAAA
jgi:uncharacterized protein YjbI with pentapeptide repeats